MPVYIFIFHFIFFFKKRKPKTTTFHFHFQYQEQLTNCKMEGSTTMEIINAKITLFPQLVWSSNGRGEKISVQLFLTQRVFESAPTLVQIFLNLTRSQKNVLTFLHLTQANRTITDEGIKIVRYITEMKNLNTYFRQQCLPP